MMMDIPALSEAVAVAEAALSEAISASSSTTDLKEAVTALHDPFSEFLHRLPDSLIPREAALSDALHAIITYFHSSSSVPPYYLSAPLRTISDALSYLISVTPPLPEATLQPAPRVVQHEPQSAVEIYIQHSLAARREKARRNANEGLDYDHDDDLGTDDEGMISWDDEGVPYWKDEGVDLWDDDDDQD